jgi:hypothetical protein
MVETPDPVLTTHYQLDTFWPDGTGTPARPNIIAKPTIQLPLEIKRFAIGDQPVINLYSPSQSNTLEGLTKGFRNRSHPCSIEVHTVDGRASMMSLKRAIEYIFDRTDVRNKPHTRPATADGDSYNANGYDQAFLLDIPDTAEIALRNWNRFVQDVEYVSWWEARE